MRHSKRTGKVNGFYVVVGASLSLLVVLGFMLRGLSRHSSSRAFGKASATQKSGDGPARTVVGSDSPSLFMYCAAGIRPPVEQIAAAYLQEYGVSVQLQYSGSNTLLSQLGIAKTGDLFLAADDSYIKMAQQRGLVKEGIPLAVMRPVIAVKKGNPKNVHRIDDLLRTDVTSALGNPDQAAIGKTTRRLLVDSGHWERLERTVTQSGVFKPTVPEVANDVKLGSVDCGIVWDTTLELYPDLEAIRTPELDLGAVHVTVGIVAKTRIPVESLRFARYMAARDKGLTAFRDHGFETVEGDVWAETPELTFFCGSVNRRAIEAVVRAFQQREGVVVNTVYNGCGILTAQMRSIHDQRHGGGFPDVYMACDRFYLDSVKDWFQDDVDVSDTDVVIAVPKGNPRGIQSLSDLAKPGVRVSIGQPEQCTIGVLSRQVLKEEGLYDAVMQNVVTQTASSAMLLPTVTTRSVDATLAYATDTMAEADKVDTIHIASPAAKAIQPFAIARSSQHKALGRRLLQAVTEAHDQFEKAGFHFLLQAKHDAGVSRVRGE